MRSAILLALGVVCLGCGGTPTAPTPTVSGLTVTVASPIKIGANTQASGSASLSSGTSQAVTTGWLSDNSGVASVTTGGLVSGVSNGQATIYVISGGKQGQQVIRVVPDFQGTWVGSYVIRSCTTSDNHAGFCEATGFTANRVFPVSFTISQSGESLSGRFFLGSIGFSNFVGPIAADGFANFSSQYTENGLTGDVGWRLTSATLGQLTGQISEIWRTSGVSGDARVQGDIVAVTRSSAASVAPHQVPYQSLREGLAR